MPERAVFDNGRLEIIKKWKKIKLVWTMEDWRKSKNGGNK
jgi:hypothetical protein